MRGHTWLGLALLGGCAVPSLGEQEQSIVGGELAQPSEFPTTVAIEYGPGDWFCTASLIEPDWVLTAAHCVEGETAGNLFVRFDDANINDSSGGREIAVAEIHGNPGYDGYAWDNDIAVLKLSESVTDRTVTPIHRDPLVASTMVTEVGYGDADNHGGGSGVLRKLITPTVDCDTTGDSSLSNANVLCFDASDGNASCYGDSGGPAYVITANGLEVAGITSGGTTNSCTRGWDIYTAVAGELAFVDQYVPMATDPGDPGDPGNPGDPNPTDPTDPSDPGNPDTHSGGCNTGHGGGLLVAGLASLLIVLRRRRG